METDDHRPIYPAAHHWLWLELLCNFDIQRLMIIAPPESAKTTWVIGYEACHVAFFPESPRIFAGSTGPVATQRSVAIRNIVQSDEFVKTFPDVLPASGLDWQKERWSVAPDGQPHSGRVHPSMAAYGARGAITGSRARETLADDVLDEENTRTQYMRDAVFTWMQRSLFSRRMSKIGRQIIIGTAWSHDDAYQRLREQGDWVVCHMPLLSESADVYATIQYPDDYDGVRLGEAIAEATL